MTVFIANEGHFQAGGWKLNKDFAFTNKDDLHAHMTAKNGFECIETVDDPYAAPEGRFINKDEKYGYDIYKLEVKETKIETFEIPKFETENPKEKTKAKPKVTKPKLELDNE